MISKLKYYVDTPTLTKIYHALFKSRLQYAIVCWGSASATILQPICVLQNRVIRHISRAPRYVKLDFLYLNYHILKMDDIYRFELGKFLHHHHNNLLPNSFSTYFQELSVVHQRTTRASARGDYKIISCKKAFGQRSIRYQGAKLWNSLNDDIRSAGKHKFKTLFHI